MSQSEKFYKGARDAVGRLFSDTSVTPKETIEALEKLKDEIDELITSIDVNAKNY